MIVRFTENRSANHRAGGPRRRLRLGWRWLAVLLAAAALPATAASAERDLFNEAERRFRGGNYAFALEAYQDFLERYPLSELSADAAYRAGVAQTQLGRYREAVETFEQVQLRHRGTRFLPLVNFWAGVSLYELEQYDRASASLRAFVADSPEAGIVPRALLYLGLSNVSLNDLAGAADALEQLRSVSEQSESTAFGVVLLGYVYALQGRYVQMLLLSEDHPPESIDDRWRAEYLAYRAEAYWQLEQYAEAEADYAAIVDSEAVDDSIASVALRRLFIAAERRGDFDVMDSVTLRAELRFRESPEQLANFWLRLGIENYRRGSIDLARFFLKRSAELGAESEVGNAAVLYLAETYLSGSDPDGIREATRVLTSQQELSTGNPWQVSLRLGDVMLRQGDFAGAIAQYESFIRAMSEDPDANAAEIEQARYLLAYALYREGRYDEALRQVRQIDSEPDRGGPLGELRRLETVLLSRTGDTAAAERSARSYVDRFPDDISARVDHLRLLYRLEAWQELLVAASALTERVPDLRVRAPKAFVLTAYLKGLAHVARGEPGAAADALDAVTPDLAGRQGLGDIVPYALYYRASSHYRQGSYSTASALLAELEDQFRGHELESRAAFLAGQSAFSIGSYLEAAAAFTRAANSNHPRAARAGLFAGRSLANSGDLDGAERQYRNVAARFEQSPEAADATFELAGVLALGGHLEAATRAYGDVMFSHSASPLAEDAAFRRAELMLEQDAAAAARDAFAAYRTEYPNGRFRDGALYWGGVAANRAGEPFRAILLWELLIDEFEDSPFRPNALLQVAEGFAEQSDYQPAVAYLDELVRRYGSEPVGKLGAARLEEMRLIASGVDKEEASLMAVIGAGGVDTREGRDAMLELARIYVIDVDQPRALALAMLTDVAGNRRDKETAAEAEYLLGEYHRRIGELGTAIDHFLEAGVLAETDRELIAKSILRAAELLQQTGRRSEAATLVRRLQDQFAGTDWAKRGTELLR